MKRCKNFDECGSDPEGGLEASGLCFRCAEELACLLADEGLDPAPAWGRKS